ncbi:MULTISPECIES: helix-turn-helix domain-containing protein [Rhizobium]|uniref:AraC-like DNA-binding protein n=1 Tax=Rhizobium paranaense TaxID=1650438 RepID=A0A7W9CZ03_9HYPH|nr:MULTISPECIES: AraC family transcriptional regulator [Rhizobium]MBB5571548.1 AraC-like DNA-binding protein [Rhizobium paranaense]PST64225.1 AraC family transcriptional regulator [Rhizobium sp. SEMIA4064]
MPFIPLSFVVAILLLILFVTVMKSSDESASIGRAPNAPFLVLILLSAFQAFLSGLRWGYGIEEVMYVAPVGAALVPPLVYCGVAKLVQKSGVSSGARLGLHAIPAILVVLLMTVWRSAIDVVLPAIFIGYAGAILLLMRSGPDALRRTPFESATSVYRALIFAAVTLLLSAALDLLVFLDFSWTQGRHAPAMVAIGNLLALIILSIASAVAVRGRAPAETDDVKPPVDEPTDKETLGAIRSLMETKRVYRDPDLNLDRLARKAVLPARQISTAINRTTGKNVSQFVNDFRIADACRLLADTDKSVTEVMFEVGFQTKSNFNREFRRVTDMTPVQWRQTRPNPT